MGELTEAYLAPVNPPLPGPRIHGRYLSDDEGDFDSLPLELVPYVVKYHAKYEDIFHVKHEGKHYLIRCLTAKEYQLLCLLRKWFDPTLGLPVEDKQAFSSLDIEEIFGDCILYPDNLDTDPAVLAGLPYSLVELAIQNSGWDSEHDILTVQDYGRKELESNLITQMATFIKRAFPGMSDDQIYSGNMIQIMGLLARAEAIAGDKFEIKRQDQKSAASKISTQTMIKEDLKAMRRMGIGNRSLT